MPSLGELSVKLTLNTQDFVTQMAKASRNMKRWATVTNAQYGDMDRSLAKFNKRLNYTARITSGILISQAFYSGLRSITNATSALTEFNEQLDYASVTYSALFGNKDLAEDYLGVLKDYSIGSIFDYGTLTQASSKLLAYGMNYKNLMFVMEGVSNLGTLTGDSEAIDRISYAIGQIYAKGKLAAEEMRQLSNAYVPIQDIIRERFNLSSDDLKSVGNLNLPAYEVINAIVDYANEQFGTLGDAAVLTITGLKNKISDSFKVVGNEIMQPVTTAYKSLLAYIGNKLAEIRELYRQGGIGGIFEHFVPDPAQQKIIRSFFATFHNLILSVINLFRSLAPVFGQIIQIMIVGFNTLGPVITGAITLITMFIRAVTSNSVAMTALTTALVVAAGAFTVLRIRAASALIIYAVTSAVYGLARALLVLATVILRHPVLAFIATLTMGVVALSSASKKAGASTGDFFSSLTDIFTGGVGSQDVLKTTAGNVEETGDAIDQFNNRLTGASSSAEDFADNVGSAGSAAKKATKDLLSFDEVFRLNDKDSGGSGGINGAIDDWEDAIGDLGGLGDIDFDMPEIPDFSEYASLFSNKLLDALKTSFGKAVLSGIGGLLVFRLLKNMLELAGGSEALSTIGRIASTIVKGIGGALLGYGLDQLLKPFTDKLWEKMEDALSLSEGSARYGSIGSTIGAVVGGAIGGIMGGPGGAIIGSAIGIFAAGVVGMFWAKLRDEFNLQPSQGISIPWNSIFTGALSGISSAKLMGTLTSGLKGGIFGAIGSIISGFLVQAIVGGLSQKFNLTEADLSNSGIGQTIGGTLGAVIGGIIGGPVGIVAGNAIGQLAGSLGGLFFEKFTEVVGDGVGWGTVGAVIGGSIGALFGPIGIAIGSLVGFVGGYLSESIAGLIDAIKGSDQETIILAFKMWGEDIKNGFLSPFVDFGERVKEKFKTFVDTINSAIESFKEGDLKEAGKNILLGILYGITGFPVLIFDAIGTFFKALWGALKAIFGIHSPAKEMEPIGKFILEGILGGFVGAITDFWETITSFKDALIAKFGELFGSLKDDAAAWASDTLTEIINWAADTKDSIAEWSENVKSKFSEWSASVGTTIDTWKAGAKNKFDEWFSDNKLSIANWSSGIQSDFSVWAANVQSTLSTWKTDASNKFSEWSTDASTTIDLWSSLAQASFNAFSEYTKSKIETWKADLQGKFEAWKSTNLVDTLGGWVTSAVGKFQEFADSALGVIGGWSDSIVGAFGSAKSAVLEKIEELRSGAASLLSSLDFSIGASVSTTTVPASTARTTSNSSRQYAAHATGGIFSREHLASISEGNKAEAIIPLENSGAMQPFVDAVAGGLISSIAPIVAGGAGVQQSSLPPLYVGTLIADDRSLRELNRKMQVIQLQEDRRRG